MNLFNALATNSKFFFFTTDKITKKLIKKGKNSLYKKDIVFVSIYNRLENKNILPEKIPLNAPFVEKKKRTYIFIQIS